MRVRSQGRGADSNTTHLSTAQFAVKSTIAVRYLAVAWVASGMGRRPIA
jgi:hypothetical protein